MDTVPALPSPLRIDADGTTTVDGATLADLPTVERDLTVICASGDLEPGTWTGVAMLDLLELATVPPETTHLLVEAADGYRVCVPIEAALGGLLAFARDGESFTVAGGYESRFVASGVKGPRTVKNVARLETVALSPGEHPESYEELWPDD